MNSKAQLGVGVILTLFIGALVGLVLLQSAAQQTSNSLNTANLINRTFTAPANGATIDLVGQELLSTPVVTNTTGAVITSGNYTIAEGVSTTDGLKRIRYTANSGQGASQSLNVSYTYGPEGYIEDGGGRSIFGLVVIFGALSIAVFLIVPSLRNGVLDFVGR